MNKPKKDLLTYLACGALALIILGFDMLIPLGVAGGVPYILVVWMSASLPDRRVVFLVATLCTLLTYVGFELSPMGGEFEKIIANRFLAIFAIWVAAILLYQRRGVEEVLKTVNRDLEDRVAIRTAEIQETNTRLTREITNRTLAERRVQKEKELAHHYLDVAEMITVVINEKQEVELINKKGCALLERREAEIIGKDWIEVAIPLSIRTQIQKVFREVLANNREDFEYYENPIRSKSGREYVIAWHNALLHDEDGRLVKILSSGVDITKQKETEQALRLAQEELEKRVEERTQQLQEANEELKTYLSWQKATKEELQEKEIQYRTIFNQSPDAIVILDPQTTLPIEFNDKAPVLLGYTREEFKRLRVQDYEAVESGEEVREHVEKALKKGGDIFETKLRMKDGQIRDFNINVRVIELGGKRVFHNIFRDITKAKQREGALKESQAQLQAVLDNSPGMIFIKDLQGRYLNCNCKFLNTFHFTLENILGKTDDQIFPPDQAVQYQKNDQKVILTQFAIQFEETAHHDDGMHTNLVNKFLLRNSRGEFYAICGMTTDITLHKQADEELRESEERLRQISETIEDVFWITDWETQNVLYASRAYERIWGRPFNEIYRDPLNWIGAVLPEDRKEVWENFVSLGEGETYDEVYRIMRPDGCIRWIRDRGFPIRDDSGKVYRVAGIAQDITVRKEAEEALKRTEHMYHQILDAIPDLVFVKKPDSRLFWANKAFCDYYGMTGEQLKGLIDSKMNKSEYTEKYLKDDDYVFQMGEPLQISDEPITRHDGDVRYFHTIKSPILDEYEEVKMIVGVARDITERKEEEKNIKTQAQIIDQIHDSVVSTDLEGYVTSWNKGAERLFGFSANEALGQHISIVYPEEEHEFLETQVILPLKEKGEHEVEVRMRKTSGEDFYAHLSLSLLRDEKNVVRGMIGYSKDITQLKAGERRLKLQAQVLNQIHDAVIVTDLEGVITSWNKGAESQYGYRVEEAVGRHISMIYPENQHEFLLDQIIGPLKSKGKYELEAQVCRKSGERRCIHLSMDVLKDDQGNSSGLIGYALDITEKKRIEETLRKFEKIINCSKDLLAFVDQTMVFQAVNKRYEEVFNISQKDILGKSFSELRGQAQFDTVWKSVLQRGLSGERLAFEHWVNFPGNLRWYIETDIDPFYETDGQISGVVVQCRNITERHEIEDLKAHYLNKVLSAQEEERARIARELHDETGQALTYLMVGLKTLSTLKSVRQIKERANKLRSFTFQTLEEVQRLAVGLHPSVLGDLGLRAAIEWYVREFSQRFGVNISLDLGDLGDSRISYEIETSLYRILQEALANVAKHAKAKKITVLLRREPNVLKMVINDDGCGFNMEDQENSSIRMQRLGLHGMRERTWLLGGNLLIDSLPGHGTSVSVEIPIKAFNPT